MNFLTFSVEVRVERDVVHPWLELRTLRQLAVYQQVLHLQERRALTRSSIG